LQTAAGHELPKNLSFFQLLPPGAVAAKYCVRLFVGIFAGKIMLHRVFKYPRQGLVRCREPFRTGFAKSMEAVLPVGAAARFFQDKSSRLVAL